jgi:Tfp pilus assembly protein PilO
MTRRDRLMILALLSVVLIGGFWFLLLSPQRKAAADAAAKLETAQGAYTAAQAKVVSGRNAQVAFRRDRTTIVKLGRVVPETDDIPTLLTQLQGIATKYDVEFLKYSLDGSAASAPTTSSSTVTPTTPTATGTGSTAAVAPLFPPGSVAVSGGLGRTPIAIELSGTYFNLQKYLRAVQRFAVLSEKNSSTNGRLLIVDGFSYAPGPDSGDGKVKNTAEKHPALAATLGASVYFAPPIETPSVSSASDGTAAPAAAGTTSTGTAAIGGLQ